MKALIKGLAACALMLFSITAFADKIIIQGEPIVVEQQGDVYVAPSATTITTTDHYFFTVNNVKRVCYREVQPALANVDLIVMQFKIGHDVVKLHCYTYSPDYFVIQ